MRTPRRTWMWALALATVVVGVACPKSDPSNASWAPVETTVGGLKVIARTTADRFLLKTAGGDVDFISGVNLGSTTPGSSPGELAVAAEQYRRWFVQIGEMGWHSVRIYTIHPPAFYTELLAYNRAHPSRPLYLSQGVYLPDESYLEGHDLYAPPVMSAFTAELKDAVAAVHGDLVRAPRRGRSSGTWTADVSPWLISTIIGVEWDPIATSASDAKNATQPAYDGTYAASRAGATPTERWLARMLDVAATAQAARGRSVPLAFVNWPTADPLRHPDEPIAIEDLVQVDAERIEVKTTWPAGTFASYHAYPYYPDFQRHEKGLAAVKYLGRSDPYAGYLTALRDHHRTMPVMITEFGVPSSFGTAHVGSLGRGQGDHSEQESMSIDADLLRMIAALDLAGGYVFAWTDEWFKFTWNTIDMQIPADRRSLWHDAWTNEQHFGILAADAGEVPTIVIDGIDEDWTPQTTQVIAEGRGAVSQVRATKDEAYLYLGVRFKDSAARAAAPLIIGIDTVSGGEASLPTAEGATIEIPGSFDYAVTVPSVVGDARAWVRASNDLVEVLYAKQKGYLEPSGKPWNAQRLIINRPLIVPSTGERLPVELFDIARLRHGVADPSAAAFDDRAMWNASEDHVEIRIPWMSLGFSDPSSLRALVVRPDGSLRSEVVRGVGLTLVSGGSVAASGMFRWEGWQRPTYRERLKAGASALSEATREVDRSARD